MTTSHDTVRAVVGSFGDSLRVYDYDPNTGDLTLLSEYTELKGPGYVAFDATGDFLYTLGGNDNGVFHAFAYDHDSGAITYLNGQPTPDGGSCHLAVDTKRRLLFGANYGAGSLITFPIGDDGQLKPHSQLLQYDGSSVNQNRQEKPHAHSTVLSLNDQNLFCQDLGTDKVWQYRIDYDGQQLVALDEPFKTITPGAGPRHMVFHPNEKFAYVLNEMTGSIFTYSYDASSGALTELNELPTYSETVEDGASSAAIRISPDGKFLYASHRGDNTLVCCRINPGTGILTIVGYTPTDGEHPRDFNISPDGRYVYVGNAQSDTIVIFSRDMGDGSLAQINKIESPSPVCIIFR